MSEVPIAWKIWDWIVDTVIVVDIFLTIFTAYKDHNDNLIDSPCVIFKNYLKSWLLLDILAVFPFDLIIKTKKKESGGGYTDLFALLRLPRLYRLIRVARVIKMTKKAKKNKYM